MLTSQHFTCFFPSPGIFYAYYNYYEGELYWGIPIGNWKYYIFIDGEKHLVCSTNYLSFNSPELVSFQIRKPFKKLCHFQIDKQAVKEGEERFYFLNDGSLFIGYNYRGGVAVSVLKK